MISRDENLRRLMMIIISVILFDIRVYTYTYARARVFSLLTTRDLII